MGTYSGGSGTELDPYQIDVAADWTELETTTADWDKAFIVTSNIDFASASILTVGTSGGEWSGVFDGNSKIFSNLTLATATNKNGTALFGHTATGSIIKNLTVYNADIIGDDSDPFSVYTSVFVAENAFGCLVDNCTAIDCTISVTVTAVQASYTGPIVGANHGSVLNCKVLHGEVAVDVTGSDSVSRIGGVVGIQASGTSAGEFGIVEDCYSNTRITDIIGATDKIIFVGGISGGGSTFDSIINRCMYEGVIDYTSTAGINVGGICGMGPIIANDSSAKCTMTVVSGGSPSYIGGAFGQLSSASAINGCMADCVISVDDGANTTRMGGFLGVTSSSASTFTDCYSKGVVYDLSAIPTTALAFNLSGGFVGWENIASTFTRCYTATAMHGTATNPFVGASSAGTYVDCIWDSTTLGDGSDSVAGTTPKTYTEMVDLTTFAPWNNWKQVEGEYPILDWQTYPLSSDENEFGSIIDRQWRSTPGFRFSI